MATSANKKVKITKFSDAEIVSIIKKNAWHIDNAMRQKIDGMQKSVDGARITLAKENDGSDRYLDLASMAETVEIMIREYTKAYNELKEIEIFKNNILSGSERSVTQ